MVKLFISKADFKTAQSCPSKLYYKKHNFPDNKKENEYLKMLADGGYMVGLMARLLFENSIEISSISFEEAIAKSEEKLLENNIILTEPVIYCNHKLIRVDILIKEDKRLKLIEVKSKSFNQDEFDEAKLLNKKYFEKSEWREYLEDVAYQKIVLTEKFPDYNIECYLMMPDKSKTTDIEGMLGWFEIDGVEETSIFRKPIVNFKGDLQKLKENNILSLVKVDEYIDEIVPEIEKNIKIYIKSVLDDKKISTQISYLCRDCEYNVTDDNHTQSGFKLCWQDLADIRPHILELGQLGNINKKDNIINHLISNNKASLYDVPLKYVEGKYNNRPYYQLTEKHEILLPGFEEVLEVINYPLHFIDFETSQMAIPYHAKMRPYGRVIFQWSCHTINKHDEVPVHTEWINTEEYFPNFKFTESLMKCLGDKGSIMTWSQYENTQLKAIFFEMQSKKYNNKELEEWLFRTAKFSDDDDTRIIDMNKLCKDFYFHPDMGGRTSIKVTLPSVLKTVKSDKIIKYLKDQRLYKLDDRGNIINPYDLLPHIEIMDIAERIKDGSGAMRAYQNMLFGINKNDMEIKRKYRDALLKYCKLDTLAMVIIWKHWLDLCAGL